MVDGIVWESVRWRAGVDQYQFDIERGGLLATILGPDGQRLTLPLVVWEGLLDALKANRSARAKTDHRRQFPVRSHSRWYDGEISEVADAFRQGRSVAEIAHAHNRSAAAIEHQLTKLGLIARPAVVAEVRGSPAAITGLPTNAVGFAGNASFMSCAVHEVHVPEFPDDRWDVRE